MLTLRLDRTSRVFAAVAMLALAATPAVAELAAVGLDANGNPNPQTTFPFWYMDTNGLALELNLHPTLGISAPPIDDPNDPNFAFSQQIGMGDEGFFFSADATVATVQRDKNGNLVAGNAILVQAIEAAFATGPPVDGDQMVFARIRIRVDVPAAGTYTITYPYGRKTYTVALDPVTGGGRAINDTIDIGLGVKAWAECLKGEIGPFLTWDADLPVLDATGAAYIGDPGIPHRVVGSPTGFNKFRVDGPPGCGIGGPGVDFVETDLFVVTGKLFTGQVPTPLVTKRATYRRTAAGEVSVFAQSTPTATASVAGGPNLPGGPIPMINDGTGRLFAHIPLADATTLPSFVSITAQSGTNTPTALNQALTDEVTILNAAYSPAAEQLVIEAVSSDHWGAGPTLTAVGLGALAEGALTLATTAPPPLVTVNSSAGGSASLAASVGVAAPAPPEIVVNLGGADIANGQAAAVDFGSAQQFQGGATRSFRVTNTGGQPLSVGAAAVPAGFSVLDPLAGPIPPGGFDDLVVRLDDATLGAKAGQVSFATNDPDESPFAFPVTGVVTPPPQLPPPPPTPPPGEVLAIRKAQYKAAGSTWGVEGTIAPARAGVLITVWLASDPNKPVIGAATTTGNGTWKFSIKNSPVAAAAGATISAQASSGSTALGFPVAAR